MKHINSTKKIIKLINNSKNMFNSKTCRHFNLDENIAKNSNNKEK